MQYTLSRRCGNIILRIWSIGGKLFAPDRTIEVFYVLKPASRVTFSRMKLLFYALLLLTPALVAAQTHDQEIVKWRQNYRDEFLKDSHSPLKAADTGFLRFYEPNAQYRVKAVFIKTPDSKPFDIETHSGKKKPYQCYGKLEFSIAGKKRTLEVYQGLDLIKKPELKDYLFIPFTDLTNNETTFGGGRYIDLRTGDIKNGTVLLDFNKAYNPYCAFADGYSCPIPPDANKLDIRIEAGEKIFGRQPEE
jgi:uncharacterized protein (DUF1684 family)